MDKYKKIKIGLLVLTILFLLGIITGLTYLEIKCWNIPIGERSGMCALLH